ncbi:hypothetical protein FRB96_004836 [Tulasnella sp. 330]|nr:hypothetical protein FRB96_004836 [Tulasnella sp. 330]
MSESPDSFHRRPITPASAYSAGSHHHAPYQHHSLPQSSFKLPPIRTLGLAHEPSGSPAPSNNPSSMDMPPPQTLPRESWSRSGASAGVRPMSTDAGGPHPHLQSQQPPDSPFASSFTNRRSGPIGTPSGIQQQQPSSSSSSSQYGSIEPLGGMTSSHGGQQQQQPSPSEGYSLGQKRQRGTSPPPLLPPPQIPPPSSSAAPSSSVYRGEPAPYPLQQLPPPDSHSAYPPPTQPHLVETRPIVPYPTHTPAPAQPAPNQSQIYHLGAPPPVQQQQPPYTPNGYGGPQQQHTPSSSSQAHPPPPGDISMSNGTMYGQRPLPPPQNQGPPPPPAVYGYANSQAPPIGYPEWSTGPLGPPVQPAHPSYNGYHMQPQQQAYPQQPPPQQVAYGAPPVPTGQYAQYPQQPQQQPPPLSAPPALEWSNGPPPGPPGQPVMMASTSNQPLPMGSGGPQMPSQPMASLQQPLSSVIMTAPADKPIAQILEHCQRIMAFANYYAGFQPHAPGAPPRPARPSVQETKEMAQRAETIVQLLFRLADESKPIRKALDATSIGNSMPHTAPNGSGPGAGGATGAARSATPSVQLNNNNVNFPERDQSLGLKKKRKISERRGENDVVGSSDLLENIAPGDENSNPNGGAGANEEGEWGMSKDRRLRMFGDNQEAYELAEKDMRTITAKRTASQGGVLPQQKTKYKKRSRATPPGKCHSCMSTETPEWRRGPDGARTLCNACGLHFAKLAKRSPQTYITIPMLQASAHKNGIGANGIVPAQPGAVNGTVGGVRAANANANGKGRGDDGDEDGQDDGGDDDDDEGGEDNQGMQHVNGGRKMEAVESLAGTISVPEARHHQMRIAGNERGKAKESGRKEMDGGDPQPPFPPPSHAPVPAIAVNGAAANAGGEDVNDDDEELEDEEDDEDYEDADGRQRPSKRQKQHPAQTASPIKYPSLQSRPVNGSSWGLSANHSNGFGARLDGPSTQGPLPPMDSASSHNPYVLSPMATHKTHPHENGAPPIAHINGNHGSTTNKPEHRKASAPSGNKSGKDKNGTNNTHHEKLSTMAPSGWGRVPVAAISSSHISHSSRSSSRRGASPPPYARGSGERDGYGRGDEDGDGEGDDDEIDEDGEGGDTFNRLRGSSNLRTASNGRSEIRA